MPNIGTLLDGATREKLTTAIVADLRPEQPAATGRLVPATKPGEVAFIVTKESTASNTPRRPRSSVEVDIDSESEALIEAACYFCGTDIEVEPTVPHEVLGTERLFTCPPCGKAETLKAISEQRNVEVIKRTTTVKHQPRITDGIKHPVTTTTKEKRMDLDNLSDAELGAIVRKQMKASLTTKVTDAKPAVEAQRAEARAATLKDVAQEQAQQPGRVYPAFTLTTKSGVKEVPTLDLSNVSTLNEMPDAKTRSPYNKALSGLGEAILNKDETTYATLVALHERLSGAGETTPVEVIVAQAEATSKAKVDKKKVKALANLLGISKDEAKARILAKQD